MLDIQPLLKCSHYLKIAYPKMHYRLSITDSVFGLSLYQKDTDDSDRWSVIYEQTYNLPLDDAYVINDLSKRFPVPYAFKPLTSEVILRLWCVAVRIFAIYEPRAEKFIAQGNFLEKVTLHGAPSDIPNTAHNYTIQLFAKDYPSVSHSDASVGICIEKCFDLLEGMVPSPRLSPGAVVAQTDWKKLQVRQMIHDRVFHQDIFYMDNPHKVEHFALHFSKYAGRVWSHIKLSDVSEDVLVKTMCDTLAICLATSYALRMPLTDTLGGNTPTGDWRIGFTLCTSRISGNYLSMMGDKRTHMEDVSCAFTGRNGIYTALRMLRDICIHVLAQHTEDPIGMYEKSLDAVRKKHFLHDSLILEYNALCQQMKV